MQLGLSEDGQGPVTSASWVGRLLMLGSRAARWPDAHPGQQLVIVVSVPVRDFAAALIGCGWMMASPAPELAPAREVAASLELGSPVRVVTQTKIVADFFHGVDFRRGRLRLSTQWQLDKVKALMPLQSLDTPRVQPLAQPGVISRMAGLVDGWEARLCHPPADIALIGTLKWLREDAGAFLGRGSEVEPIASLLLPEGAGPYAATWSTKLYAASRLEDELPLAGCLRAVVLDGGTAVTYLSAMDAPVVIVVLDRGAADQSAAELVVQYRNNRGNPLSIEHDIRWPPSAGMEALGFWVPL